MATQIASIKHVHGTPFIVDGFNFLDANVKSYFLTHFHSDHYCGLNSGFDIGTIYCTEITARLVTEVGLQHPLSQPFAPCDTTL